MRPGSIGPLAWHVAIPLPLADQMLPQWLKATVDFVALTARLEAAPFQIRIVVELSLRLKGVKIFCGGLTEVDEGFKFEERRMILVLTSEGAPSKLCLDGEVASPVLRFQRVERRGLVAGLGVGQFRYCATGETSAVEIESQWTARLREQAGVFLTLRMRSAEENPRPSEAWTGHPRK